MKEILTAFFAWLSRIFTPKVEVPVPTNSNGQQVGELDDLKKLAPWVFEALPMLGWTEHDHDKELTKLCWPATDDCKGLKTVIGAVNAWCSGFWCGVMERLGLKHTRSGSAASWRTFGVPCGYVFGAFLPLRHVSGGNHITVFLWWIDKEKMIAACIGANQLDAVSIAAYNLSGNSNGHDEVIPTPRWPKGINKTAKPFQPDGWVVGTKLGGSTR